MLCLSHFLFSFGLDKSLFTQIFSTFPVVWATWACLAVTLMEYRCIYRCQKFDVLSPADKTTSTSRVACHALYTTGNPLLSLTLSSCNVSSESQSWRPAVPSVSYFSPLCAPPIQARKSSPVFSRKRGTRSQPRRST